MTRMQSKVRFQFLVALVGLLLPATAFGQAGVSSMSMSVGRAGITNNARAFGRRSPLPEPEMIRVEEFINYHRHDLPLPESGAVRLDVQSMQTQSGKRIYQFGLTTPRAINPNDIPPLNLVLVIDRSGSMTGDRIANVKKALLALVERLRKHDRITIVGFSNDASVHLSACEKTKSQQITQAIEQIIPGGSTNLHAGLMLGYRQARKNFDPERTNRVILLTDGIANAGVTDLEKIAHDSKAYNEEGIDLSTIGLGKDLNHQLLRQLADAGRGLIHFVDDKTDIKKTFVREVDALLAPAAKNVELLIDFGDKKVAESAKFFGYQPKLTKQRTGYRIKLDDLNCGATQVVLVKVPVAKADRLTKKRKPKSSGKFEKARQRVSATLKYQDSVTGKRQALEASTGDRGGSLADRDEPESLSSIERNYAIALLSNGLFKACEASQNGDFKKTRQRLIKSLKSSKKFSENDKHVKRMAKIVQGYYDSLNVDDSRNTIGTKRKR